MFVNRTNLINKTVVLLQKSQDLAAAFAALKRVLRNHNKSSYTFWGQRLHEAEIWGIWGWIQFLKHLFIVTHMWANESTKCQIILR